MEEKQNTRQVDSEANAAIFNHGRPNIASLPQCQAADKVARSVMQCGYHRLELGCKQLTEIKQKNIDQV